MARGFRGLFELLFVRFGKLDVSIPIILTFDSYIEDSFTFNSDIEDSFTFDSYIEDSFTFDSLVC